MNTNHSRSKIGKYARKLKSRRKRRLRRQERKSLNCSVNTQSDCTETTNCQMNSFPDWSQLQCGVLDWRYEHEIAYWKSKAEALSYENKMLHTVIDNIILNQPQGLVEAESFEGPSSESEDEGLSEDYLAFLQVSDRHKRKRDNANNEALRESFPPPSKPVGLEREEICHSLYGDASGYVIGLETKLQHNYETYKDLYKPNVWPTIPLNL